MLSLTRLVLEVLNAIEPYYILSLISFGLVGNTISFTLFTFTKLKYQNSNLILSALALADNGFLLTLLVVNLSHLKVDLFNNYELICRLTVYFTYVFSFLSIWLVVTFSVERLIVVYFPFFNINSYKKRGKKLVIGFLFLLASVLYSFSLFATGIDTGSIKQCATFPGWNELFHRMALFDVIITIFTPMFIIFVVNVLISIKLMKTSLTSRRRQRRKMPPSTTARGYLDNNELINIKQTLTLQTSVETPESPLKASSSKIELNRRTFALVLVCGSSKRKFTSESLKSADSKQQCSNVVRSQILPMPVNTNSEASRCSFDTTLSIGDKSKIRRMKAYSKTTRMLLIISTIFFCLNVPMAFSKLRYLVANLISVATAASTPSSFSFDYSTVTTQRQNATTNSSSAEVSYETTTPLDQIIERLACFLYYLNYSINFVLYTLNGERFKETMVKFFKRLFEQRRWLCGRR